MSIKIVDQPLSCYPCGDGRGVGNDGVVVYYPRFDEVERCCRCIGEPSRQKLTQCLSCCITCPHRLSNVIACVPTLHKKAKGTSLIFATLESLVAPILGSWLYPMVVCQLCCWAHACFGRRKLPNGLPADIADEFRSRVGNAAIVSLEVQDIELHDADAKALATIISKMNVTVSPKDFTFKIPENTAMTPVGHAALANAFRMLLSRNPGFISPTRLPPMCYRLGADYGRSSIGIAARWPKFRRYIQKT